jgi:hypothetical protein
LRDVHGPINLVVCDVNGFAPYRHLVGGNQEKTWVLDVCLDYFATFNPFMCDVEHELRRRRRRDPHHGNEMVAKEEAEILRACFSNLAYRHMEKLRTTSPEGGPRSENEILARDAAKSALATRTLQPCHFNHPARIGGSSSSSSSSAVTLLSEITITPAILALEEHVGLPHHPAVDEAQRDALLALLTDLVREHPPLAGMIARSELDGFTPRDVCAKLENDVIDVLSQASAVDIVRIVED